MTGIEFKLFLTRFHMLHVFCGPHIPKMESGHRCFLCQACVRTEGQSGSSPHFQAIVNTNGLLGIRWVQIVVAFSRIWTNCEMGTVWMRKRDEKGEDLHGVHSERYEALKSCEGVSCLMKLTIISLYLPWCGISKMTLGCNEGERAKLGKLYIELGCTLIGCQVA
jgi:hypothetical protein